MLFLLFVSAISFQRSAISFQKDAVRSPHFAVCYQRIIREIRVIGGQSLNVPLCSSFLRDFVVDLLFSSFVFSSLRMSWRRSPLIWDAVVQSLLFLRVNSRLFAVNSLFFPSCSLWYLWSLWL